MNIKNIFVLSHLTNTKSEDIRNKKLNIGIQICNTWCILFEYIRATMNTFDEPPPPWSKFSTSFIHICADLRRFCCLLSRVYKQEYICKKISQNTNIEYIRSLQHYRIRISNILIPHNLTEYEYRIYLFLATWPNTNIEYIRNKKIEYSYSNM